MFKGVFPGRHPWMAQWRIVRRNVRSTGGAANFWVSGNWINNLALLNGLCHEGFVGPAKFAVLSLSLTTGTVRWRDSAL
jgi:hypothetical protein